MNITEAVNNFIARFCGAVVPNVPGSGKRFAETILEKWIAHPVNKGYFFYPLENVVVDEETHALTISGESQNGGGYGQGEIVLSDQEWNDLTLALKEYDQAIQDAKSWWA